jgi:DNA-binding CsgD family transcriptional regulator/tetratricopeptide (TPR) repeat protein
VPGPLAAALTARTDADELFAAMLDELRRRPTPTVFVVEDAHWADNATLDLVRYVARRIDHLPALLVLTYRDVEVDHPLRAVLGALPAGAARRLPLTGLSPAGVAELAAHSTFDIATLVELTDGNPFFVTEVLAAPDQTVPPTVADAVLARVGVLSRSTRAALEPLAVVPHGLPLDLLGDLIEDLAAVGDAERAGVLRVEGKAVMFRHELARRAFVESLPAAGRLARHAEVLRFFEQRGGVDPSRLLHHAVGAADDAAVIRYGIAAAREATRVGAHRQAVACYEQVLARRHDLPPEQAGRLYEVYSWSLSHANRFAAAAAAAAEAVASWRQVENPAYFVRPLVALARQQWLIGQCDAALATASEALAVARAGNDGPSVALALVCRGGLLVLTDQEEAGLPVLDEGLALAEHLGELGTAALIHDYLGSAQLQLGQPEGEAELQRSVELARQAGNHEFVMRGYYNLAEGVWRLGRYDTALEYVAQGEDYGRDRDFPAHQYFFRARRHRRASMRGEWAAAEAGLRGQLAENDDPGMLGRETIPTLARILVRRGEPDAVSWLERSASWAERTGVLEWLVPTGIAWIEHAWLAGRPTLADPWPDRLLAALNRPGCDVFRGELMRYLARLGSAVSVFPGCPDAYAAGIAGDWTAAAALWADAGDPYEQALELLESGDVVATTEGLELLNALGATPAARLARQRLRDLGVTRIPRRRDRGANPGGLTDRQMEILRMVAAGMSNRQIAERLVISSRTVDHHVSAVLRQLGARSRQHAAELLASFE